MDYRTLDPRTFVSGQIAAEDVSRLGQAGVTMIVNNRPDGEQPDQPSGASIAAAAASAGINYRHIPVSGGFSRAQVTAMDNALAAAEGKVLAFCKSGTRSTFLWALARAQAGVAPDAVIASAAEAGFDLSPIRAAVEAVAAQG